MASMNGSMTLKRGVKKESQWHRVCALLDEWNAPLPEKVLSCLRTAKQRAEIEATEACVWLRSTGFPQYAQLFEESKFPIEVNVVKKDHDFLEEDLLDPVLRRLQILNKCSSMKIEMPSHQTLDESDDEDPCAISEKWRYSRGCWSRRSSNNDNNGLPTEHHLSHSEHSSPTLVHAHARLNSSSRESLTTTDSEKNEGYTSASSFDSPAVFKRTPNDSRGIEKRLKASASSQSLPVRETDQGHNLILDNCEVSHSKPVVQISLDSDPKEKDSGTFGSKWGSFKNRMGGSFRRAKKTYPRDVTISGPVMVETEPFQQKMQQMNCMDLLTAQHHLAAGRQSITPPARRRRAQSEKHPKKRFGRVFSEPTSPSAVRRRQLSDGATQGLGEELSRRLSQMMDNNNERKDSDDVFGEQPENTSSPSVTTRITITQAERFNSVSSHDTFSMRSFGDPPKTQRCLSSSSSDSCQVALHQPPWRSQETIGSDMDLINSPSGHRERIPSFYDNFPHTLHSSLDNVPTGSSEQEDSESELMREIYNLKNLGHLNANDLSYRELEEDTSGPAYDKRSSEDTKLHPGLTAESEKIDILHNISELLLSEKYGDYKKADERPRRGRSNSLPISPSDILGEAGDGLEEVEPTEGKQEMMGLHDELERILDGINESISEIQGQINRNSSLSSESQVSSPAGSHLSTPFNSPVPSPLSSPNLDSARHHQDSDTGLGSLSPTSVDNSNEKDGKTDSKGGDKSPWRERRDSGVGSSLTRPSGGRRPRIRWHSFQKSHRPSLNSRPFQISNLSVSQLMILRKLSLLRLTALMEKYSVSHRSGWSWMVPRFRKRGKSQELYKDRNTFGVPLLHNLRQSGQPLPQTILYAMRYLRKMAAEAVGIFRKPGVRSRILQLKRQNESEPDNISYDGMMAYDVADMLKQYFRELPEPLMTAKLSETFINIFTSQMPKELRIPCIQAAIMLMPDENREVLQSLLLFLTDIAANSQENQMTAYNLAVCFAPSLFQLNVSGVATAGRSPQTPRRGGKMSPGKPDQKELLANVAANECMALMIREVKKLFMVPEELLAKYNFSYMDRGDAVPLEELGRKRGSNSGDYHSYLETCIQGLLKESREKFKGWVACTPLDDIEVSYKKVGDGHPLRLWKCSADIEGPPHDILQRVLRERHLWDEDLLKWRVVETLENNSEVFQYVVNSMAPHPSRDYCVVRSWRTNLPKGACVLVSTSVEHDDAPLIGGVRGTVLASRFLIEPCGSGRSKLTYICRIDTKGRTTEWYNKAYGHIVAGLIKRIIGMYQHKADGPETKV
ncbi:rho GTPase-activating protein 7-like isoform X4 [Apostichopus japonicus]|uniref:rho GTPase-activating protein 7-like isoform X4 n=1 Tax=Stichopus japonicus TaxID=307972 RepID=UPI003AB1588D